MKKTCSKIFAVALATTTMAAFYAAPVMAAQKGLTDSAKGEITAAASVTINGVTLSGNGLTAASDDFVVSRTGAVTAASLTTTGAITANGGSTITAARSNTTATSKVAYNGISDTIDNGTTQAKTNVTTTSITNSIKNYADGAIVNNSGTNRTQNATTIKDIVYDGNKKAASTLTLSKTAASLKTGTYGFATDSAGVISITGTNFKVANTGAITANGGSTIISTATTGAKAISKVASNSISDTVYGVDGKTVKSQLTLNQTGATLKADNSSIGISNANGNVTITAKDANKNNALLSITSKNLSSSAAATTITAINTAGNITVTNVTNSTGITDKYVNTDTNVTVSSAVASTGITDTFTADGTTHKVTTNAAGTTFTGDTTGTGNRYNYSVIDGQKATFGGSATNKTVIDGGTAAFTGAGRNNTTTITGGEVATNTLKIDDDNYWDKDGLTVGGTQLKTDANGDLVVSGLEVENVYLQSDGFKLGKTGQETFTVDTATGDVTTKGSITADGSITAASYNGVAISTDENTNNVTVGGVDITALNANTDGIVRTGDSSKGYTTTIEGNTAISGDGIVVSNASGVSTKAKADGYYVKDANSKVVAKLTADGVTADRGTFGDAAQNVVVKNDGVYVKENGTVVSKLTSDTLNVGGENVIQATDKVRVNADVYKIDGTNLAWKDADGNVNIAADRGTFGDTTGTNTVVKSEGIYIKNGSTIATSLENGELNLGTNALTDQQLGYVNGMITGEGTLSNVSSINGAAIERVDAVAGNEESKAGLKIAGVTLQDGNVTAQAITAETYNGVTIEKNGDSGNVEVGGVDITQMESDIAQSGKDIGALQQKTGGIVRRTSGKFSTTEIEGAAGVNNKSGFYVLGEGKTIQDENGKVATISRDGNMALAGNIRAEGNASIAGTFITENVDGKASLSSSALNLSNGSDNTVLVRNDGIARFGALNGANVRMEDGVLTVNSTGTESETKLSTAGLELTNAKLTTEGLVVNDKFNIDSATGNISSIYEGGTLNVNADGFAVKHGDSEFKVDSKGAAFTNGANNGTTTINGGTITTGTTVIDGSSITTDTLKVKDIVLGNKITDEDGNDVGNLNIGADGSIKLVDSEGVTTFEATTEKFSTHYGRYELYMDAANGFSLGYTDGAKLTLTEAGYAFSGTVNLGNSTDVSFIHNSKSMTLNDLLGRVETLEQKTQGISYNDETGSTTIANGDSKLSVDKDGTNFVNGENGGTTNINGGVINADRSEIGNMVPGASGSGAIEGSGVVSDADAQHGHFANADGEFAFRNDAQGYTSIAKQGDNVAITNNNAEYNNSYLTDGSSSSLRGQTASSITSSVTAGDKSNSLTQTADSTVSSVTDGTNTNTLTQTADSTVSSITDGTNTYSSSQTASGLVTKVSDGTNSSTVEQTATSHVITTTGEDGKEHSAVITGSDVVINQGTEDEVSLARTENRVTNLEGEVADLNRRVDKLDDRIDKVGAMAAAIANLRTMGYDPTAPTEFAIGIGQYRSDTGVALGLFHYPNRDFMLSLSVSTSGDEVMGGIGATWKFGRKKQPADQAKVNKAEELKLAAQKSK